MLPIPFYYPSEAGPKSLVWTSEVPALSLFLEAALFFQYGIIVVARLI